MVDNKSERNNIDGAPSDLQNETADSGLGSSSFLSGKDSTSNLVSNLAAATVASEAEDKDNFSMVWGAYKKQSAGVISDVRRKEHYEKPSVRKKMKSEAARRKRNKRNRNSEHL